MTRVFETVGKPHPDRAEQVRLLSELGFGWADLDDEPYWIDQAIAMREDVYRELMDASATLWSLFDRTVRHFVIGRRELYAMLGVPPVLWEALDKLPINGKGLISRYARFDFAISDEGDIKLLELNADTPTGYVEAAEATPWVCAKHGIGTRNGRMKELIAQAWAEERPDTAACVAYGSHAEDSGTIDMLIKHSGLGVKAADCLELWVDNGVLKDGRGEPIRRMFALYPKEWMHVDDGGDALAYALETGNLTLFNPVHAILLQSKGLQALIWGLYELGMFYDEEERETISRYMLPTYNKAVFDGSYVSKSMFGREGGSVTIYNEAGELEAKDTDGFDTSSLFPRVYQKRAELASVRLEAGGFRLLTGVFVLNGEPCGLLGRAGGLITGNTSHFVAIGVGD
ncbi:glutathionylspermidine synthase family protein [Paenibacillus thailandensis]|uniref:Glutathionylspermidine synthase family protein n=1 Tax=Paenibacillus thailandensis TaxID=393250 RepID=A0ABW5QU54_9BACL